MNEKAYVVRMCDVTNLRKVVSAGFHGMKQFLILNYYRLFLSHNLYGHPIVGPWLVVIQINPCFVLDYLFPHASSEMTLIKLIANDVSFCKIKGMPYSNSKSL